MNEETFQFISTGDGRCSIFFNHHFPTSPKEAAGGMGNPCQHPSPPETYIRPLDAFSPSLDEGSSPPKAGPSVTKSEAATLLCPWTVDLGFELLTREDMGPERTCSGHRACRCQSQK